MYLADRLTLDKCRRTTQGFLAANPRIARTGIQIYSGDECERPDLDRVRVYRPSSSVFDRTALRSLAHKPITRDHPPTLVDATNWRQHAVGHMDGDIAVDGESIRVPMMICDAAAVHDVESGISQVSVGYTCDLKWEPGKTADGEEYDAIQTNIRANHVAIVATARGGASLRIGDGNGDEPMNMRKITVDGIQCDVTDTSAQVIERHLQKMDEQIAALHKQVTAAADNSTKDAAALTTATTSIQTKDAEIVTLKKQVEDARLTPVQIDALVAQRQETVGKAKAILGDAFTGEGKTAGEIQRHVVDTHMGVAAKGWNDAQVEASFNTITANVKPGGNSAHDAARDFSSQPGGFRTNDATEKAHNDYTERTQNAWKGDQQQRTN